MKPGSYKLKKQPFNNG